MGNSVFSATIHYWLHYLDEKYFKSNIYKIVFSNLLSFNFTISYGKPLAIADNNQFFSWVPCFLEALSLRIIIAIFVKRVQSDVLSPALSAGNTLESDNTLDTSYTQEFSNHCYAKHFKP